MKHIKVGSDRFIITRTAGVRLSDKFNRATKLATNGENLLRKVRGFCQSNTESWRKQCAIAFLIMWKTGIRVGNEESASGILSIKGTEAFGLTTLTKQHVKIRGTKATLEFVGKKAVEQRIVIDDAQIVAMLKQRISVAEGTQVFDISDYHMRKFMGRYVGGKFQVKDVRTMRANMEFSKHLLAAITLPPAKKKSEMKKELNEVLLKVSDVLGNTAGICKRSYVDPKLIEIFTTKRYASGKN